MIENESSQDLVIMLEEQWFHIVSDLFKTVAPLWCDLSDNSYIFDLVLMFKSLEVYFYDYEVSNKENVTRRENKKRKYIRRKLLNYYAYMQKHSTVGFRY